MTIDYAFLETPSPSDIDHLIRLYRQAGWWPRETEDAPLVSGIVSGSHRFLVARRESAIIAMGRAISDGVSDAYIQDVTVDSVFRRQGIGSRIVERLVEGLECDGITWIGLIAERKTHPFYRSLGFDPMADSVPMLRKS